MKRASSIQEWVATYVALSVKCQRIQQLEKQLAEKQEKIKCYEIIFKQSDGRFQCNDCNEWFENDDMAVCEGDGCSPMCQECDDRSFCSYCGSFKCVDCTSYWCRDHPDCSFVICEDCSWRTRTHNCPNLRNN